MKHKKLQKKPLDSSSENNVHSDEHSRDCETPESVTDENYFKNPSANFPFSHFKNNTSALSVPNTHLHADSEPEEEIDVVETEPEEAT